MQNEKYPDEGEATSDFMPTFVGNFYIICLVVLKTSKSEKETNKAIVGKITEYCGNKSVRNNPYSNEKSHI